MHVVSASQAEVYGVAKAGSGDAWTRYCSPPTPASFTAPQVTALLVPFVNWGSGLSAGTGGAEASIVVLAAEDQQLLDSLVKDLITPIIGMMGGTPDFSALKVGPIAIG